MNDKKQLSFEFNPERCVQCHACETACKCEHDLEPGIQWRKVLSIWDGEFPDVKNKGLSLSCMHCADPACVAACPSDAIYKREEDGAVLVDKEKCTGCRTCFSACPVDIPQFGTDEKMQKCDLCIDRLGNGGEPACVATCVSGALCLITVDGSKKEKSEKAFYEMLKPFMLAQDEMKA